MFDINMLINGDIVIGLTESGSAQLSLQSTMRTALAVVRVVPKYFTLGAITYIVMVF